MRIIILGGGKVGESLARNLANEENDIVVVDLDFNHLEFLKSHLDIQTVHGSASNPSILLKAGIEDADLVIAVTSNDDANMLSCLIATKLFKIPRTIARIRGHDYHQYPELYKNKNIPIQTVIYPTGLLIQHISRMIQYPDFSQILSFFNNKIFLVTLDTHEEDWFHGKTIAEINHKVSKTGMKLVALLHQKNTVPLLDDYVVQIKDKLFFLGEEKKFPNLLKDLERKPRSNQRIMIAGGGEFGICISQSTRK